MQNRAKQLRSNQTDAEKRLWQALRNRSLNGHKFRRQHVIEPYICDVVCINQQLIVEVDGGQHAAQAEQDRHRTRFLNEKGFSVIRFWNHEVLKATEAVLERILDVI